MESTLWVVDPADKHKQRTNKQKLSMTITNIKLSVPELKSAVQEWLGRRGIHVEVTDVDKEGYPVKCYNVDCTPLEATPTPATSEPEPVDPLTGQDVEVPHA